MNHCKNILITGGGKGLGNFVVKKMLECNYNIAVLEKNPDLIDNLNLINSARLTVKLCDVTNRESVQSQLNELIKEGFIPDVLINNAGLIHSEPLINFTLKNNRQHSLDNWNKVISSNLTSTFNVSSAVVDQMIANRIKGVVISISSISAEGNPGQSAYSAAKAGVIALTKTWAQELGPLGFRFLAISPGFMDTSSTKEALGDAKISNLKLKIPARKLGNPESFFNAIQFCIENDYFNGEVINLNGGLRI